MPIQEIRADDERFPNRLATLAGAPSSLYCRGAIELLKTRGIAVVGNRQTTSYGVEATQSITDGLARAGLTIISGLALGIDAVAHRAALDAGGKTIAVLGSGIDDTTIGPRQNLSLARDILANGGLICSEYPPGTEATKWTFPARNRIVSGLSQGVLVTEAARKSGALITARLGAEQGRDAFAVPGSIFWPRSAGPLYLIQNGALAVSSAQEILDAMGVTSSPVSVSVSTQDPVQSRIVAILDDGPHHLDSIISESDIPAPKIMAALTHLELTGSVISMQNGYWRRT